MKQQGKTFYVLFLIFVILVASSNRSHAIQKKSTRCDSPIPQAPLIYNHGHPRTNSPYARKKPSLKYIVPSESASSPTQAQLFMQAATVIQSKDVKLSTENR